MRRAWIVFLLLAGCSNDDDGAAPPSDASGEDTSTMTTADGDPVDAAGSDAASTDGATSDGSTCSPRVGEGFSAELAPYPKHPTAASKSVDDMFSATKHAKDTLSAEQEAKRREILAMYKAFGMDPSLDAKSFYSSALDGFAPKTWSKSTPAPLSGEMTSPFSIDAPFNHPIACDAPAVALPDGYFKGAQLHCVHGFDGVGYAACPSGASDPVATITSKADGKTYMAHVRGDAPSFIPSNAAADVAVGFLDAVGLTLTDCYRTKISGTSITCDFARQSTLPTLGDFGGTTATATPVLAGIVRKGEATSDTKPIGHGIIFVSNRMWKARVFPARSGDAWIYDDATTVKLLNGLVPYGAVVRLDPSVDLAKLDLKLPARRILEAVQTYGAYLVNSGGPDFGIYTSSDASEFDPWGPIYDPTGKNGIQDQIGKVLATNKVFVVAPPIKR